MPEGSRTVVFFILYNVYGYLWKERAPPKGVDLSRKSVACNIKIMQVSVACNTLVLAS